MPEEINRLVTDALAHLLFTPSSDADKNLIREGIPENKIFRVGNIMVDTLVNNLDQALKRKTYAKWGLRGKGFVYTTLHRPSNVDQEGTLASILEQLKNLSQIIPVVFPLHPRTRQRIGDFGMEDLIESNSNMLLVEPVNYLDSICLASNSKFVLTDSGGLQEETTFLGTPCLTLRPNTERPVTIAQGTNKLTGIKTLWSDMLTVLNGKKVETKVPKLWDGRTAERIVQILLAEK